MLYKSEDSLLTQFLTKLEVNDLLQPPFRTLKRVLFYFVKFKENEGRKFLDKLKAKEYDEISEGELEEKARLLTLCSLKIEQLLATNAY